MDSRDIFPLEMVMARVDGGYAYLSARAHSPEEIGCAGPFCGTPDPERNDLETLH